MMSPYYVYILFDWRAIPRYVGKGKGNRWLAHERHSSDGNWFKHEFIEQTWAMLGEIPKIKVAEGLRHDEAVALELLLTQKIGICPIGPLTNMTETGGGKPGHRPDWFRDLMSKLQRGVPHTPEVFELHKKLARDPKRRAKISAALTGRKQSPEHLEKNRLKSLGRKHSAETRAKMSSARQGQSAPNKGMKWTETQKAKLKDRVPWNKGRRKQQPDIEPASSQRTA